jgi:hypothetical protein
MLKESKNNSMKDSIIINPAANPIKKTKSLSPGFRTRTIAPPNPVPNPARRLSKTMPTISKAICFTYFLLSNAFFALYYLITVDKLLKTIASTQCLKQTNSTAVSPHL